MLDPSSLALSRRGLLRAGAAAGATLAAARPLAAQQAPVGSQDGATPQLADELVMLLRRATFGWNVTTDAEARAMGYLPWLEQQLDPFSIDNSVLENALAGLPSLSMSGQQLYDTYEASGVGSIQAVLELDVARLARVLYSPRQLYERLVDFWSDHFNLYHFVPGVDLLKTVDDREVIRPHALGSFRDMLRASVRSGAMMLFLDNFSNFNGLNNENYSRELLELHTLGVDGPYTEQDVREFARVLTGWSLWLPDSGRYGEHRFTGFYHDPGPKQVLGFDLAPGGGKADLNQLVDWLAVHPATARHICGKLASHLVCERPPATLVDAAAQVWVDTGSDIAAVVRVLLDPSSVVQGRALGRPKLMRPLHLWASVLRSTYADEVDLGGAIQLLFELGHLPFAWPAPDGYADTRSAWGPAQLGRWNLAADFFAGQLPGHGVSDATLAALLGNLPLVDPARSINLALCGGALDPRDEQEVRDYVAAAGAQTPAVLRDACSLALSSPSYQLF